MKTVLVTGAAGFIGHKTCLRLLSEGIEVIGIDSLNNYYDVTLKHWRLKLLKANKQFHFVKCDIRQKADLETVFVNHKIDAVINLAAMAGVPFSLRYPQDYIDVNVTGMLNVLDLMRQYDVNKIVFSSSSSLYSGEGHPSKETMSVNKPFSPYAASKKSAELFAYTYHYQYSIDVSILRFFTVYGPAGRPDMSIFRFIKWIDEGKAIELFGDGTQSRDFTYVDDLVNGIVLSLKPVGYEIFNLGGGQDPITLNEVISFIEKYLGKKAIIDNQPFMKSDVMSTSADISKAKEILDWSPKVAPKEGLKLMIEWYLENKDWLKDVELKRAPKPVVSE